MYCKVCKKKNKHDICTTCEEQSLWKKYIKTQKTATKAKCKQEGIKKKSLIIHLKESISKLEKSLKKMVCELLKLLILLV